MNHKIRDFKRSRQCNDKPGGNRLLLNNRPIPVAVLAIVMLHAPAAMPATGIEQIQELIAEERLDEALRLTNNELRRDEADVNYQFMKGLILIRLNRLEQAVDVFTDITDSHPELPEPYNNLAVIYAALGDLDKARQALQEAINTHPSYATAHENIGDIYAKLASEAYNQALQLDQENVTAKAKLSLINDLFSVPKPKQETRLAEAVEDAPSQGQEEQTAPPETEMAPAEPAPPEETADRTALKEEIVESVKETVNDWAEDWSSQDVEAYLSHYGPDYTPPGGQTLAGWKQERRERLSGPRFIRLDISEMQVELLGEDYAQATFMQKYQSDTYSDLVSKLLLFSRVDGRWLIVQEATK